MQFSVGSILVRFEVQFLETYQRFRRFEVRLCGSENLSEHFWHEIVLSNFVGRIFSKTVGGDVWTCFRWKGDISVIWIWISQKFYSMDVAKAIFQKILKVRGSIF